jgi:PAS domain S-box-containing protein
MLLAVAATSDEGIAMDRLRILHVEDNETDAEIIRLTLEEAGLAPHITRVDTSEAFQEKLRDETFDVIVCDYSLPGFDGRTALQVVREARIDVPFIFVSGTIGEEKAVSALKEGATDYVLKDRLSRLPAAVWRCLEERRERQARKAAEDRIREQAALLDEAREAITVHGLDRRIAYWSRGAERLYGWTAEEAAAGAAEARVPPQSRAQVEAAVDTVIRGGKWDGTLDLQTRDGRRILVESHWTCLRHPDGSPRAVLVISSDVTQARQMEAQLHQKQRLETIGMVAGGIAHDLNNVLAPLVLGIGSLRRKVLDEHGVRLLNTMDVTAQRGAEILHQVLSFARGTQGPVGPVDVGAVIRGMERLLAATLSRSITLEIEVAPDLAHPHVDSAQLQQVLLNLCVNARDAMPAGGQLTIKADNAAPAAGRMGKHVLVRVIDTGEGIAPEARAKIFEAFYTTKAHGTGIGLATVASIVKRHGGVVEVDSVVGQGTEFRVYLPVATPPVSEAVTTAAPGGAGRWLMVVDEGSVREIARQTLEAYGYRVFCPPDAESALRTHAEHGHEIAAAIVNVSMPEIDSARLVREMRARTPTLKIIATDREVGIRSHAGTAVAATLRQPYSPEMLLEAVGRALRGRD